METALNTKTLFFKIWTLSKLTKLQSCKEVLMGTFVEDLMAEVKAKNPSGSEFHHVGYEVADVMLDQGVV